MNLANSWLQKHKTANICIIQIQNQLKIIVLVFRKYGRLSVKYIWYYNGVGVEDFVEKHFIYLGAVFWSWESFLENRFF